MAKFLTNREEQILTILGEAPPCSSSDIYHKLKGEISLATLKRSLVDLEAKNLLTITGRGKNTRYQLNHSYQILKPVDTAEYFKKEIDERSIRSSYDALLVRDSLSETPLFTPTELNQLNDLQEQYKKNIAQLSPAQFNAEQQRLAIDLSWKSSQIEGNTYSLLETERLLKDKLTAAGKTKDEAIMLLNHKEALDFVIQHPDYVDPLSVSAIEDIHSILVKDLGIDRNLRTHRVGISGTNYRPPDNEFQIKEAMGDICNTINGVDNVFAKALLALVLISYLQPFADGNKRTARIISNAILINNQYCPISFRTVDSIDYKKAMLIFYEQHSIYPFKKIFIDQFQFAVNTYF